MAWKSERWRKKLEADNLRYGAQIGAESAAHAQNFLRKLYLLSLLHESGRSHCQLCGEILDDPNDLALDHIKPWRNQPDAKELFWDLANLRYVHKGCNIEAAIAPRRRTRAQKLEKIRETTKARLARLQQEDPERYEAEKEEHRQKMKARYWAKRESILAQQAQKRDARSDDEVEAAKNRQREYHRRRREAETPEQREIRLAKQREANRRYKERHGIQ